MAKAKNVLRRLLVLALDKSGTNALFRFLNRDRALILWYHGVCNDQFDLLRGYDERHVPISRFREQLSFLNKKGYRFVTLSQLSEKLAKSERVGKVAVVTFDDGFRNVVENAYPVMKELGARGCFYLVSSLIGTDRYLWTDNVEAAIRSSSAREFRFTFRNEPITYDLGSKESREKAMKEIKRKLRSIPNRSRIQHLEQFRGPIELPSEFRFADWEQIKRLDSAILEIGCHTRTHPDCSSLTTENELEDELAKSKAEIERMANLEVRHFCYPGSSSGDAAVVAEINGYLKKYGYSSVTTTIPGLVRRSDDSWMLKRVVATEDFLLFKACTSGSYLAICKLKNAVRWLSGPSAGLARKATVASMRRVGEEQ